MKSADFYTRHMVPYPARVNRISFSSIRVLEFLTGYPWDDMALGWVHGLRPSFIRVVDGAETCDAQPWRVTVYVNDKNIITSIRQEVEVWLPEGVENGHDLRVKMGERAVPSGRTAP